MTEQKIESSQEVKDDRPRPGCPWCGHQPFLNPMKHFDDPVETHAQRYSFDCINPTCKVKPSTMWCLTKEEAEKVWRTRV